MPQLRISDAFFKNERERSYSDWELAVWRELFQNSIDQDAGRIDIGLTQDADIVRLVFADDGPGMTRDVLEQKYFSLGETTKGDDDTKIGGFGRARILTCFAMRSYAIFSQGYKAVGRRAEYDIHDHAWTNGCRLEIEVDDTSLTAMRDKLDSFLSESRLDARLFVNGERVLNKSPNPGRHVRNLEVNDEVFARVWVNKSAENQTVIVRVNGVAMFTTGTSARAQVIVELEPAMSRKVLTGARDGLQWRYQRALNAFLAELAVDTQSALKSRFGRRTTVAQNGGMKSIRRALEAALAAQEVRERDREAAFHDNRRTPPRPAHEADNHRSFELPRIDPFDAWLGRTFGDIYIFDETESAAVRRVIPQYCPVVRDEASGEMVSNWKSVTTDGKTHRRGGNLIRVLLMWKTAIAYALEVAMEPLGKASLLYAVGFTFKDKPGADCRQQDGGYVFCFNPVDAAGKLDFSITKRLDLKRLMTLAKHEVTHVSQSWHDEDFAGMREAIDERFDEAECFRRMKAALRNAMI